jgi:hypothetical protein
LIIEGFSGDPPPRVKPVIDFAHGNAALRDM